MFAEDQLERLRTFPDIGRDDLIGGAKPIPGQLALPGMPGLELPGPATRAENDRELAVVGVGPEYERKGPPGSVAAPGRAEQAGDLCDGRVAGLDVAHGGARGLVPGLGHDRGAGNNGPVSTAKASSFLNAAGRLGG